MANCYRMHGRKTPLAAADKPNIDMLAEKACANGWAGLVINGVIRDVDEIGATDLGVQALGTCPVKTEKLGVGQRDITVEMGGVVIGPGDYIYADSNGVLVSKTALA